MGRPWWYDSYSGGGGKPPPRRARGPSRRFWAWFGVLALSLLVAESSTGFVGTAGVLFLAYIDSLCEVLALVVFVRAIASWFVTGGRSLFLAILDDISGPLIAPLRRVIPLLGRLDITPLIAIILLLYVIPYLLHLILGPILG